MKIKTKILTKKLRHENWQKTLRFGKKRLNLHTFRFRHRFLRTFQAWYLANEHRFLLPLSVCIRRDSWIRLSVGNIPPENLCIYLAERSKAFHDGSLDLIWAGEHIDHLMWLETYTTRCADGFYCAECHREGKEQVFKSRLELWQDHIFEEILETVNNTIAAADRIEFYCYDDGDSSVEFIKRDVGPTVVGEGKKILGMISIRGVTP